MTLEALTLEELQTRLSSYVAAEAAVLKAQDYTVGQGSTARRVTRADLAEVRQAITDLAAEIGRRKAAQSGARRLVYLRPF